MIKEDYEDEEPLFWERQRAQGLQVWRKIKIGMRAVFKEDRAWVKHKRFKTIAEAEQYITRMQSEKFGSRYLYHIGDSQPQDD